MARWIRAETQKSPVFSTGLLQKWRAMALRMAGYDGRDRR
jgi:hypothetical protein